MLHTHLLLLSDTMCPGLCLEVILGVPVRVKNHNSIGSGQIDPQTPGTSGEEETEVL